MKYSTKTLANLIICGIIAFSFFFIPWLSLMGSLNITPFNGILNLNEALSYDTYNIAAAIGSALEFLKIYLISLYLIAIFIVFDLYQLFIKHNQESFNNWCKWSYFVNIVLVIITFLIRFYIMSVAKSYGDQYGLGFITSNFTGSAIGLGFGLYLTLLCSIVGLIIPRYITDHTPANNPNVNKYNENISKIYNSGKEIVNRTTSKITGRSNEDTGSLLPIIELSGSNDSIKISNLPATIGRDRSEVNNYVFDNTISRKHALLDVYEGSIVLTDLGSAYGTFINGEEVIPEEYYLVQDNDELKLGNLVFKVNINNRILEKKYPQVEQEVQTPSYEPQYQEEPQEVKIQTESLTLEPEEPVIRKEKLNPEPSAEQFDRNKTIKLTPNINRNETIKLGYGNELVDFPLVGLKSEKDGSLLTINKTPYTFGSDEQVVDEVITGIGISKKHFQIEQINDRFYITDLGSTNGTFVNEVNLTPFSKAEINPEDIITIGQLNYKFEKL